MMMVQANEKLREGRKGPFDGASARPSKGWMPCTEKVKIARICEFQPCRGGAMT